MMTQEQEQQAQYVTIDEAAEILKDELEANGWRGGANTIKSWLYRKRLPAYARGRRQVVKLDDVRAYIRAHGLDGDIRPWDE